MQKLVFLENNRPVTDSLTVAETFGKRHADVLRSIENLECSAEFNERNFASVTYIDSKGETRPKVIMTEQGFTILVMGYTGKKAMRFKEDYINEFDRMREQLTKQPQNVEVLDERKQRIVMMKTMIDHEDRLEYVEDRMNQIEAKVDEQITLDSGEQRKVQKAIARKVYEIEIDETARREHFRQIHREIKDRWAVPSYKDVRRNEVDGLLKYIESWRPRIA